MIVARSSFCGWCQTGQCCGGRAFPGFVCTHTGRCELNPEEAKTRDERVKAKAMNRAREMREEGLEAQKMATFMEQLHAAWEQLDREVDEIMRVSARPGDSTHELNYLKARSRGKAEVLALFSPIPFHTADAIAKESWERYQARQRNEVRQTLTLPTRGPAIDLGDRP